MTKRNRNKNKFNRIQSDDNQIKSFIIILIVILLISGAIYLTSSLLKNNYTYKREDTVVDIDYNKLTIGTLFSPKYDNYYALIYNSNDVDKAKYAMLISRYNMEEDHKKIYFIDLSNSLNNIYYNVNNDNKSNPNAKVIDDLDLGDLTLLEIKDKKIIKYIEDYKEISKELFNK